MSKKIKTNGYDNILRVKPLENEQFINVFPTYNALMDKITYHRENLNEYEKSNDIQNVHNVVNSNVFSIMGKRGSGKTSALFTLKNIIEDRFPGDVLLPIIMPEMIPEDERIIGWLLASLEEKIEEIEKKLKSNRSITNNSSYFKDCQFLKENALRKAYDDVMNLCSAKEAENYNADSLFKAMGENKMQTLYGYRFSHKLMEFFDTFVNAIALSEDEGDVKNPFIYLMFDDVDLTPNKIMELLSSILQYLSHPNIVIVITADEDLFYQVVEYKFRKQFWGQEERGELDEPPYKTIRETAQLYMDKIMPPANRFYLEVFDSCKKKKSFINKVKKDENNRYNVTLEDFLSEQVDSYIIARKSKAKNFLYYNKGKKEFLDSFFLFWGNTSRQLVNERAIVSNLFDNLTRLYKEVANSKSEKKRKEYEDNVYKEIQGFIRSTINTNIKLKSIIADVEKLVDEICPRSKNQFPIYINYRALEEFYIQSTEQEDSQEKLEHIAESVIALFVLLFFVENVLLIGDSVNDSWSINRERGLVHGAKYLVSILDSLMGHEMSLVRDNGGVNAVEEILYNYEVLLQKPHLIQSFNISRYSDVKDYLYPLYTKSMAGEISKEDLYNWHSENPIWFRTITKMIFLMYARTYAFTEREMKLLQWRNGIKIYNKYLGYMINEENEEVINVLSSYGGTSSQERKMWTSNINIGVMYRTKIFEYIEERFTWEENNHKKEYDLFGFKDEIIRILEQNKELTKEFNLLNLQDRKMFFRTCCFWMCIDKRLRNQRDFSKEVVRNELQRIRSELIQAYIDIDAYYLEKPQEVRSSLSALKAERISFDLLKNIGYLEEEINSTKKVSMVTLNKFITALNKEIKREMEDDYSFSMISDELEECKSILLNNLKIKAKGQMSYSTCMNIIVRHEALIHMQNTYLESLLQESKEQFESQNIDDNSFYSNYLHVMLELLKRANIRNAMQLQQVEGTKYIHLGQYIEGLIREAVDEYYLNTKKQLDTRNEASGDE